LFRMLIHSLPFAASHSDQLALGRVRIYFLRREPCIRKNARNR
jgi:hypothetical protein